MVGFDNGTALAVMVEQQGGPGQGQLLGVYPAESTDPSLLRADPFVAPTVNRPALEGKPPQAVVDRDPLPFCGEESNGVPNAAARECFARAVVAGGKAEFIKHVVASEGDQMVLLYRHVGTGSMEIWQDMGVTTNVDHRWQHLWCDLTLLTAPRWFVEGTCAGGPI